MFKNVLAAAVGLALSNAALAAVIDPDGTGFQAGNVSITGFDWSPTSFLARGGQQAIANFLINNTLPPDAERLSTAFDLFTHASVASLLGPGGVAFTPPGLNSGYEITMIMGFGETVTSVVQNFPVPGSAGAGFQTTPGGVLSNGNPAFFEMYLSPRNSNQLSGSGFGDGTLLLRASLISSNSTGSFFTTAPTLDTAGNPVYGALDQTTGDTDGGLDQVNDWPDVRSVQGSGNQSILTWGNFTDVNADFWKILPETLSFQFDNISVATPFVSVDPSDCFNLPGQLCTADVLGAPRLEADGPLIPNIGSVNGLLQLQGGSPDFIAQTDFNSPVSGAVPEPGTLTLLGLGLMGLAARRRKAA